MVTFWFPPRCRLTYSYVFVVGNMSGLQVNKLLQRIRSGWHKDGILWRFNACGKNEASGFWINWSCRTSGMFSGSTHHLLSPPNPQKFKVYLPGEKPTARVDKRKCGEGDGCAVCVCVCVCCWGLLVFCYFVILFLFHFLGYETIQLKVLEEFST